MRTKHATTTLAAEGHGKTKKAAHRDLTDRKKHGAIAVVCGTFAVLILGGLVLFVAFGGTSAVAAHDDGNTAASTDLKQAADNTVEEATSDTAAQANAVNTEGANDAVQNVETGQQLATLNAEVAEVATSGAVVQENPVAHPTL